MTAGRWEEAEPVAWRNGGGVTRELAGGPGWRLSVADIISDADFSDFTGSDRVLTLVEGSELTLEIDDDPVRLSSHEAVRFDGAARVRATVTAPVRVLNLVVDRRRGTGSVELAAAQRTVGPEPGATLVIVNLDGDTSARTATGGQVRLGRFDWLLAVGPVELRGAGVVGLVRVSPAPPGFTAAG